MAKIDFSTIEGFEEMTAEEKLAAIENYEIPDRSGDEKYSSWSEAYDKYLDYVKDGIETYK